MSRNANAATIESTATETIALGDTGASSVSSVYIQLERSSDWVGSVTVWGRLTAGAGTLPRTIACQNLRQGSDVLAGTAITQTDVPTISDAAPSETGGLYAIRADAMSVELRHVRTAGTLTIVRRPLQG